MRLEILIDKLKKHFAFLGNYGFDYYSYDLFNKDSKEYISIELKYSKLIINNSLDFMIRFKPRIDQYSIYIYIYNEKERRSLSINDLLKLEKKISDDFINKINIDEELARWAEIVEHLFKTKLPKFLIGEEWISLPYHDPRDDY